MERTTLMDANTRFDKLVEKYAREDGGVLNAKKKMALDHALELHAQAAEKLKVSSGNAVPEFAAA